MDSTEQDLQKELAELASDSDAQTVELRAVRKRKRNHNGANRTPPAPQSKRSVRSASTTGAGEPSPEIDITARDCWKPIPYRSQTTRKSIDLILFAILVFVALGLPVVVPWLWRASLLMVLSALAFLVDFLLVAPLLEFGHAVEAVAVAYGLHVMRLRERTGHDAIMDYAVEDDPAMRSGVLRFYDGSAWLCTSAGSVIPHEG